MAVKSFQGPRASVKKEKSASLLVRDIMTKNIICFTVDQSIHDVMKAFIKHKISGGPVIDENMSLIGIISEGDCMKEISDSRYFNMPILDKSRLDFKNNKNHLNKKDSRSCRKYSRLSLEGVTPLLDNRVAPFVDFSMD